MSTLVEIEEDPNQYRCCCGCMHVKTGVKVIIGIGVLVLTLSVIGEIHSDAPVGIAGVAIGTGALAIGCLIAAVATEKRVFLLPYLILQTIRVILDIVLLVMLIIYARSREHDVHVIDVVTYAVGILFPIWYISIVYGYYKYLKHNTTHVYDNFA